MVLKSNLKKFSRIIGLTTFILCFALLFISFQDAKVYAASWESESNNTRATADYISVNAIYNGNIKDYSDVDYYRVSTSANGTICVKFTHNYVATENKLWEVYLEDSNGNTITSKNVRGVDTEVKLTKIGLPAGTYYVCIDDTWSYYDTATYSVTAEYVKSTVWETEDNETRPLADSITVNKKYYGNINDYSDVDYYRVSTSANGTICVKFTHNYVATENKLWEVYLEDSNGNTITSKNVRGVDTEVKLTKIGLPAGTYYVCIDDTWSYYDTATYSVTAEYVKSAVWETEDNETRPLADSITVNKKYYGNINDYSDVDYYKIKLSSSKTVSVKFVHNRVATENKLWEVYLEDSKGNIITSKDIPGNVTSVTLTKVGLPAGIYYICVDDTWSYYDTATYSVNAIVPATSAPKNVYVKRYGHDDIKVSWSKVSAATGYYVYAKKTKASKWTYLGSTTKTAYKKANLTDGAKYHFKIVPYKKLTDGNYSGYSKTSSSIYTLKKMSKPKFSKSGTKVKVIWSKVSGADGYHVVQYAKKNGKYVKVKGYFTTNSSKLFTAKKGKTYYYKVRAYDKVGDSKIYAPYSSLRGYKR